jgi:hypothetical protein
MGMTAPGGCALLGLVQFRETAQDPQGRLPGLAPAFTRSIELREADMLVLQKVRDGLMQNPLAWLIFAAFVLAVYGNYQRGKERDRLCDLINLDDPLRPGGQVPLSETDAEEIRKICTSSDD